MLNNIINNMKNVRLSSHEEYERKELLESIRKHLNDNIDILEESFQYEYKNPLDKKRLMESFDYIEDNKIGIIDSIYKNDFGRVSNNYVPYGVVGVVIRNDISLYNYAAILNVLIQSNNSIVIELYRNMGTVNILIEMLNQVIDQVDGINKIMINKTGEELIRCTNLDLLLFIGDKSDFKKINISCEKKYYGIGNYELIIDKELDKNLIEEAQKRKVKIVNKTKNEDFYDVFNDSNSNYCTGFMSDNKNEIRKFIANTKSTYLIVNAIPTLQDEINIDINDLMYKKSTLIWDEK